MEEEAEEGEKKLDTLLGTRGPVEKSKLHF